MSDKTPRTPAAPPVQAPGAVPADVLAALDRMCTPLHESWLTGATAQADAKCMQVIRDYIMGAPVAATVDAEALIAACVPGGGLCDPQAVADAIRAHLAAAPSAPPPEPLHPNHLPDLRYVRNVLKGVQVPSHQAGAVAAAINGMNYIIKRTEEAAAAPPAPQAANASPVTLEEVRALAEQMWKGEPLPGRVLRFGAAVLGLVDAAIAAQAKKEGGDGRRLFLRPLCPLDERPQPLNAVCIHLRPQGRGEANGALHKVFFGRLRWPASRSLYWFHAGNYITYLNECKYSLQSVFFRLQ